MRFLIEDIAVVLVDDTVYLQKQSRAEPVKIPAYLALEQSTQKPLVFGQEAKEMYGKTPVNINVNRALQEGFLDPIAGEFLIKTGMRQMGKIGLLKPRVIVAARNPDMVVKRHLKDVVYRAGAWEIYMIPFAMATAIGMELDVEKPELRMVLSLSTDWFEFAVISLAGVLASAEGAIGLRSLVEDIRNHLVLTQGFSPDEAVLEGQLIQHGIHVPAELPGWEAWAGNTQLGRQNSASLQPKDLALGMLPSLVRLSERIKCAVRTLTREQQASLNTIPLHVCGHAFTVSGLDDMLSTLLGMRVHILNPPTPPAVAGCLRVMSELGRTVTKAKNSRER
jgi:rod shape-determining protein MreB